MGAMKSRRFVFAMAAAIVTACVMKVSGERVVFTEDFGTSETPIDAARWQSTHAGMPRVQWPDGNPKDAHAAGDPKRQFVTTGEYGPAPVSVEFDLTVWNVAKSGYNLFGFVSPDSIWNSHNGIGWRITSENGRTYAQSYTTCHEGAVPGWHEHHRGKIEIPAHARLRIDWKPGVWAAFYLNGELREIMTLDIADVRLRFGTDVQSTAWTMDDVKVSLLEPHEEEAMLARIESATVNEFPSLCRRIGFDPNKEGAFYFIHITDPHIGQGRLDTQLGQVRLPRHTENFRRFAGAASRLRPKPAFVVITGDLTQDGTHEDWQAFRQLMSEMNASVDVPVYLILGNHDVNPGTFLSLFPGSKLHYSFDLGGVRFIALHPYPDSSGPRDALSYCALGVEQMAWLRNRVAEFKGKTVVVFVHHPLLSGDFTTNDLILDMQSALKSRKPGTEVWIVAGHRHCDGLFHVQLDEGLFAHNVITPDLALAVRFRYIFVQDGRILGMALKRLDSPIKLDPSPAAWAKHTLFYSPKQPILLFVNVPDDEGYLTEERNCTTARGWRDITGPEGALVYRVPVPEGATHLGVYAIWDYLVELSADGVAWRTVANSNDPERPFECKMPMDWGRYYKLAIPIPEDLVGSRTLSIRFRDPCPGDKHWLGMESAIDWFCFLGAR